MSVAVQRTRRRQQREETRAQIVGAALEFLHDHSFRDLSVDALMTRTGHSRTVFYRHFDDIPTLVLTLIEEVGGELVEVGREWVGQDVTNPEEARRQLRLFVDFYARNGRLVRAVAEASHHDELVHDAYLGLVESFVTLTEQAMQRRAERGEIAPVDAPEVARALVWMLNGYLLDRFGQAGDADPERVLDAAWTIWTRTLFPPA